MCMHIRKRGAYQGELFDACVLLVAAMTSFGVKSDWHDTLPIPKLAAARAILHNLCHTCEAEKWLPWYQQC